MTLISFTDDQLVEEGEKIQDFLRSVLPLIHNKYEGFSLRKIIMSPMNSRRLTRASEGKNSKLNEEEEKNAIPLETDHKRDLENRDISFVFEGPQE